MFAAGDRLSGVDLFFVRFFGAAPEPAYSGLIGAGSLLSHPAIVTVVTD
jgi:hypothetical protein